MLEELFLKPSPVGREDPRLDLSQIGYFTVLSSVLWFGVVALWGGIGLGSNIFSRPLTMIAKVSPRFVSVYSVTLLQQPGGEHFTAHWFPDGGGNFQ